MTATTDAPEVVVDHDEEGRPFGSVLVRHPGSRGLVVHFSAFFGRWGDARPYRDTFSGYFHRLKMLGSSPDHDWLFLCDAYGAYGNGCYYLGPDGDRFVERAMTARIDRALDETDTGVDDLVLVGSSMGGTAALRLGLRYGARGIAAVCPHIDLDTSALRQDRVPEVAWVLADGDVAAEHNRPVTREIGRLVEAGNEGRRLPDLFVQSCQDDTGVHGEQVVPLVDAWRAAGGSAVLDERAEGGHTSDFATRGLLLDVVGRLLDGRPLPLEAYRDDPAFAGTLVRPPLSHRVRAPSAASADNSATGSATVADPPWGLRPQLAGARSPSPPGALAGAPSVQRPSLRTTLRTVRPTMRRSRLRLWRRR